MPEDAQIGAIVRLDELGEISHVNVDVVVYFEKKIHFRAMPVQPVEETSHFQG